MMLLRFREAAYAYAVPPNTDAMMMIICRGAYADNNYISMPPVTIFTLILKYMYANVCKCRQSVLAHILAGFTLGAAARSIYCYNTTL